jgi:phytanoyl-CoA hydroxylase
MSATALPALPSVAELSIDAARWDCDRAAAIYREHGCLVVRGLLAPYVDAVRADIDRAVAEAYARVGEAVRCEEGWKTSDGSLFIPGPAGSGRDKQIMCLALSYLNSAAFFRSALDERVLDLAEQVLGPAVELFDMGQALYKEGDNGHPKVLHQDASYFEHRYEGPLAMLGYAVDTDLARGALHIVPGSHRLGLLPHVDTFSHLGLDEREWPWERALAIEGQAGDAVFFNVLTIHGSKNNTSGLPRPVFISRYRAAHDYVTVSATTARNRAEREQAREQAKKRGQEKILVRGYRARS